MPGPISDFQKFCLTAGANQFTDSHRPVPTEGRLAIRHERGAGCGGRGSARDERGLLRTAKSCGSDAPIVGVKPGENRDGVRFAQNMCPSKGTMDVFVEPVLPHPSLVILGVSPVALSLAAQARQLGYHVTVAAPAGDLSDTPDADTLIDGYQLGKLHEAKRFIVVSTQGKGDEVALRTAVSTEAAYHAFVGSRRKHSLVT